jgi:hypothetical protein
MSIYWNLVRTVGAGSEEEWEIFEERKIFFERRMAKCSHSQIGKCRTIYATRVSRRKVFNT